MTTTKDGVQPVQAPRWCDFVSEERAKVITSGVPPTDGGKTE